ncbi:zona pellucida sperm-binding protein 3 receptor-like isoform X2 [Scyliorhinus torazame]|uniref:zona pellucida sperm-binding protein 3 receptor-like isoform X2 n=1 Tax=Scyliorhinus torazame TaxID=75743 RepID=UPI003B596068
MLKDRENWGISGRLILALTAVWVARVTGDCGKLPVLENGSPADEFISNTTFPVGTRATYKCLPGYTFQEGGSKRIVCRNDSTWSPLQAVCEPRNCGNPGEILNGYYTAPNTTFGSIVTFSCDKGYIIVGKPYRICTADGWDGQVPTCQIVMCPDPPPISNGTVSSPPSGGVWIYGSVAKYSCTAGLFLIGEETIICTETKEWSRNPPRCQVVQCARPKTPDNGKITSGFRPSYSYQDAIMYQCDVNFEMVGKSVIVCTENNTFVPPPPTCEPRTPEVSSSTTKGTTEVSSFMTKGTKGTTEVSSSTTKGTTDVSSSTTKGGSSGNVGQQFELLLLLALCFTLFMMS